MYDAPRSFSLILAGLILGAGCASQVQRFDGGGEPDGGTAAGPGVEVGTGIIGGSPWDSPEACEALVAANQRAPRTTGTARVVTWNVRWFPLGQAPFGATAADGTTGDKATDVAWLGCAVAWMQPDVVALEEVLTSPEALTAFDTLVQTVSARDAAPWAGVVLDCPDESLQHQALLYRTDRVTLAEAATVSLGEGCGASLRPAFRGRLTVSGLPLSLFTVHLKSGSDARSYDLRRQGMAALEAALGAEPSDRTPIALGDFNTMGCYGCTDKITASTEIATLGDELSAAGLDRAAPDPACSEYSGAHAGLLDHIAVRGQALGAHVDGACRALACARAMAPFPPAFATLSDHCPQWIDLPLP